MTIFWWLFSLAKSKGDFPCALPAVARASIFAFDFNNKTTTSIDSNKETDLYYVSIKFQHFQPPTTFFGGVRFLIKETFITQHQRGGALPPPPFDFNSINWKNGGQNMITYAETKKKSIFWKDCALYRENKNQTQTHFRWKKQEISLKIKLQGAPNVVKILTD